MLGMADESVSDLTSPRTINVACGVPYSTTGDPYSQLLRLQAPLKPRTDSIMLIILLLFDKKPERIFFISIYKLRKFVKKL
jgi:hypothetical protein